ncbi:MAG: hypothetical protein ACSHX8_02295 [Opitutaceae bacterium]
MNTPDTANSLPAKSRLPLIILILVIGGLAFYIFYLRDRLAATPEAATRMLVVDVDDEAPAGVLPHTIDDVTEFKRSLSYLKKESLAPEYRETTAARRVVEAVPVTPVAGGIQVNQQSGSVRVLNQEELKLDVQLKDPTGPNTVGEAQIITSAGNVEIGTSRDWGGVVLVPDGVKLSRAHTTGLLISRVEAHPIDDGRLRVWARIENLTGQPLPVETGCEFRFVGRRAALTKLHPVWIPASGAIDVDYVSSEHGVNAYTLMAKLREVN